MSNVIDLIDQTIFLAERSPLAPTCCSASGCTTARSTSTGCGVSITIFSGDGCPAASNAHHCRSGAIAGYRQAIRPTSRSSRRLDRAKNSTPGWASRPTPHWIPSTDPDGTLRCCPFTDGGTGVSLLISHCLTDGVGLCEALADAACGRDDAINWPAAASRRRWQAMREDARQTVRDIPGIGRAVVAAARLGLRSRRSGTGPVATTPAVPGRSDERITVPMATIFVDADEWDARAHSLGGTSNTLLAALAARLAQRVGRGGPDGSVTLAMPVNERVAGAVIPEPTPSRTLTSRSTRH